MAGTAKKTDPKLWETVKKELTEGDKGGRPGQWSARKAQFAASEYKKRGGDYQGPKTEDNHLRQWQHEDWGTKSGGKSTETGERYLPKKARDHLSDHEYAETTAKKRADTARGKQFSPQPEAVARKTAEDRDGGEALTAMTRTALMRRAAEQGVTGRSRMSKQQLLRALSGGQQ